MDDHVKAPVSLEEKVNQLAMRVFALEQEINDIKKFIDPRCIVVKDADGNVSWEENND